MLEAGAAVSAETLAAIETRQQQHDADIELLMTEVRGDTMVADGCRCGNGCPFPTCGSRTSLPLPQPPPSPRQPPLCECCSLAFPADRTATNSEEGASSSGFGNYQTEQWWVPSACS